MTRQEMQAWFNLAVALITVAAYLALLPVLGPRAAASAFSLLGLWGFSVFFYRKSKPGPEVVFDERDRLIHARSTLAAYAVFWVVFVGACMGLWALKQEQGSIPVDILPMMPVGGMLVVLFVQSVAMLLQYRQTK